MTRGLPCFALLIACAGDPPRPARPTVPAPAPVATPASAPAPGPYHDPDHKRGALPSADQRASELAFIRDRLDRQYAHRADKLARYRLDEEALFAEAARKLAGATTWAHYDAAIYDLLAQFHDSHLSYHPPQTAAPSRGYDPYRLGFETVLARDHLLVASVEPDGDAARAGLHAGDEITAVDGQPLASVLARQVEQRAWSRPHSAEVGWAEQWTHVLAVKGEPPRARSVVATTRDGRTLTIAIAPRPAPKLRPEKVAVDRRGPLAIVTIHSLEGGSKREQQIDDALASVRDAPALVVDLRGDRGGIDVVGQRIVADLAEGKASLGTYRVLVAPETLVVRPRWNGIARQADGFSPPQPLAIDAQPAGKGFHGRLAVLVDAGCVSTCEVIAAALRADLRATLVGETTGGSSGAPVEVTLPTSHGEIAIPTWNLTAADGKPIEGDGVVPDVEVFATPDALAAGTDLPLQTAIDRVQATARP
ncbi:MAG TPA: S41 family peptidase [Kofleriaceae bacterium]|nr:S41 family peptidase [Kofleriaceae bacterium]